MKKRKPKKPLGVKGKILEALARHPDGLNAAKVRELVIREYPVKAQSVASLLVHLAREGRILNGPKHACPGCGVRSVVYRLREEQVI